MRKRGKSPPHWALIGLHPAIDSPSIRGDNGSGFTAMAVRKWLGRVGVERLVGAGQMTGVIEFDAAAARRIEAAYLTTDVVAQRIAVHEALDVRAGERVLDIGSGPGLLAHELAKTVGPEGRVCGVDISDAMIEMARHRCAGQPQCTFENAEACALSFEDEAFDAVVSTQVYEYVADIPAAMRELHRVVRRGGRVCVIDTDYDSLVIHTEHPERMRRVLEAWDAHFVHPDLPRKLAPALTVAGFEVGRCSAIPIFNREYHPNAFSYHLLPMMSAFARAQGGLAPGEAEAWLAEFEELDRRGGFFYSLNRYLFTARRPNS